MTWVSHTRIHKYQKKNPYTDAMETHYSKRPYTLNLEAVIAFEPNRPPPGERECTVVYFETGAFVFLDVSYEDFGNRMGVWASLDSQ